MARDDTERILATHTGPRLDWPWTGNQLRSPGFP
jgi:hypothetical protein